MREEKNNENAQFVYSKINFRYIFCIHSDMIVDRNHKVVMDLLLTEFTWQKTQMTLSWASTVSK